MAYSAEKINTGIEGSALATFLYSPTARVRSTTKA